MTRDGSLAEALNLPLATLDEPLSRSHGWSRSRCSSRYRERASSTALTNACGE
jgi:hypothetical protein